MSQENLEIVRALFARWNEGDYSSTDWAAPDIAFVINVPGSGTSQGVEAMGKSWGNYLEAWKEFRGVPQKIIEAGNQVLVLNEFGGRGSASGVPITGMRGAALFTFEAGRVVRLALFGDWDEALEAAGLRE
jgi:ketosteroid isomerase-like protein